MKNLLVLSGLVGFTALPLEAVVIVHVLPEPIDNYEDFEPMIGAFFPYDIDGNGTIDFTFVGDPSTARLRTERANRLVIVVAPPQFRWSRSFIAHWLRDCPESSGFPH